MQEDIPYSDNFIAWSKGSKYIISSEAQMVRAGVPFVTKAYHGTHDVRGILTSGFEPTQTRGDAFFFSSSYSVANTYADDQRAWEYQNAESHSFPAYLNMQNPMVVDAEGQQWRQIQEDISRAKADGHDGIVILNSRNEYNDRSNGRELTTVFAVFDRTQIKSAKDAPLRSRIDGVDIGGGQNTAVFNAADPNILNQSAFHGSPSAFDRFSTGAIGTGEGRQAFGWGLYFASRKSVAEFYRDELSHESAEHERNWAIIDALPELTETDARKINKLLDKGYGPEEAVDRACDIWGTSWQLIEANRDLVVRAATRSLELVNKGSLYEVDVPDSDNLLDWDKPLSDQSSGLREKLDPILGFLKSKDVSYKEIQETKGDDLPDLYESLTGQEIYQRLVGEMAIEHDVNVITEAPRLASEALGIEGIPGLQFLDGRSRRQGEDYRNFVIWDDSKVTVEAVDGALSGQEILNQPAFHGTPHNFDRFSLESIGTGEGHQTFGWGLYFAGRRQVAEWYQDNLSDITMPASYAGVELSPLQSRAILRLQAFHRIGNSIGDAIDSIQMCINAAYEDRPMTTVPVNELEEELEFTKLLTDFDPELVEQGNLYQADIPEDDVLLDWDTGLEEQPEYVTERLSELIVDLSITSDAQFVDYLKAEFPSAYQDWGVFSAGQQASFIQAYADDTGNQEPLIRTGNGDKLTGEKLYNALVTREGSRQAASELLSSLGIPGLRYFDGFSRSTGLGHHNYVIWDEGQVTVEAINDQVQQSHIMLQSAYHGTAHRWEGNQPSLAAVGSGEGNHTYGWGLYFADEKEVGEFYRTALGSFGSAYNELEISDQAKAELGRVIEGRELQLRLIPEFDAERQVRSHLSTTLKDLNYEISVYQAEHETPAPVELISRKNAVIEAIESVGLLQRGNLYQVDIPDNEKLLNWDLELNEQPSSVQEILKSAGVDVSTGGEFTVIEKNGSFAVQHIATGEIASENWANRQTAQRMAGAGVSPGTGRELYQRLVKEHGSDELASRYLSSIGIPGLRYLDQESRSLGEGTYNYVIWDEEHISVEAVNDQVDPAQIMDQAAYHGSPHQFSEFTLQAVGSGEGAQAYGWGLYFAERKEVAEWYRKTLSTAQNLKIPYSRSFREMPSREEMNAVKAANKAFSSTLKIYGPEARFRSFSDYLDFYNTFSKIATMDEVYYAEHRESIEARISETREVILYKNPDLSDQKLNDALKMTGMLDLRTPYAKAYSEATEVFTKHAGGTLFQVDIPSNLDLLVWDAPLSKQPASVKEALLNDPDFFRFSEYRPVPKDDGDYWALEDSFGNPSPGGNTYESRQEAMEGLAEDFGGEGLYRQMAFRFGSSEAASRHLNALGIPGLRYLDGASRFGGGESYNYVIWDDKRISVDAINDQVQQARLLDQTVYHGTASKFSKFSLSAVGTGEKAAAYGFGLYFTDTREIANWYRDKLNLANGVSVADYNILFNGSGDITSVKREGIVLEDSQVPDEVFLAGYALFNSDGKSDPDWREKAESWLQIRSVDTEILDRARSMIRGDIQYLKDSYTYESTIPDASELMAWDLPLNEQPQGVIEKLRSLPVDVIESMPASVAKTALLGGHIAEQIATGEKIYHAIYRSYGQMYGGDTEFKGGANVQQWRAVSATLNEVGIPGLRYKDGRSRHSDGGGHNYVIWDEARVTIDAVDQQKHAAEVQAASENVNRAGVHFVGEKFANILLHPGADVTSLVHEGAHVFLEMYGDVASQRTSSKEVRQDFEEILEWFGVSESQWRSMSINERREYHEMFAESFELYVATQMPENYQLAKQHNQFGGWMTSVYGDVSRALPRAVQSPEITALFDRMLVGGNFGSAAVMDVLVAGIEHGGRSTGLSQEQSTAVTSLYKRAYQYFGKHSGMDEQAFVDRYTVDVEADVPPGIAVGIARESGYAGTSQSESAEWTRAEAMGFDMSEDARFKRAEDLGFDTRKVWYHGTADEFTEFDVEKFGTNEDRGDYVGKAVFVSGDPKTAMAYAEQAARKNGGKPRIIPLFSSLRNPLVIDRQFSREEYLADYPISGDLPSVYYDNLSDHKLREHSFRKDGPVAQAEYAKSKGYDGMVDKTYPQAAAFEGSAFRSIHAAFTEDAGNNLYHQAAAAEQEAQWSLDLTDNTDTSVEARMARAKELGFDTDKVWYHGTPTNFEAFDKGTIRERHKLSFGFHFTDRSSEADIYAGMWPPNQDHVANEENSGANVIASYIRYENPLIIETEHAAASMEADINRSEIIEKVVESSRAGNPYDAVVINRHRGEPEWDGANIIVFDPAQIRSVHANFSLDHADSPDILNQSTPEVGETPQRADKADAGRLVRAQAMGFDTSKSYFHGAERLNDEFKVGVATKRYTAFSEHDVDSFGIFMSPSRADAATYGAAVGEYFIRSEKKLIDPTSVVTSPKVSDAEQAKVNRLWEDVEYILQPEIYTDDGKSYIDINGGVSRIEVDAFGDWVNTAFQDGLMDWSYLDNPNVVRRLVEKGYDSVAVIEPSDDSGESLFVVNPNQIRAVSAEFDPAHKDSGYVYNQSAYHGSPHYFDDFSLDAVGTGEGFQAYGWGLYFASERAVAEYYRDELTKSQYLSIDGKKVNAVFPPKIDGLSELAILQIRASNGVLEDALVTMESRLRKAEKALNDSPNRPRLIKYEECLQARDELATFDSNRILKGHGHLYNVSIPESELLLDWDKDIKDQPPAILNALLTGTEHWQPFDKKRYDRYLAISDRLDHLLRNGGLDSQEWDSLVQESREIREAGPHPHMSGEEFYQWLANDVGCEDERGRIKPDSRSASELLNGIGIVGSQFLDAHSRQRGEGTYNFVIWDHSTITVDSVESQEKQAEIRHFHQLQSRASISFASEKFADILLNQNADASSLLHEGAHLFLEMQSDMVHNNLASEQVKEDYATVLRWFELSDRQWRDMSFQEKELYHERFAETFELYLATKTTPLSGLDSSFDGFGQWMNGIYGEVNQALPLASLSPEIKDLFDRMTEGHPVVIDSPDADSIRESIYEAGRKLDLPADVTRAQAAVLTSAYEYMAKDSPLPSEQFYDRYQVNILNALSSEDHQKMAAQSGYAGKVKKETSEWNNAYAAGLDMSESARMNRAESMNFNVNKVWYHGTDSAGFREFEIPTTGKCADMGIFLTDSLEMAATYQEGRADMVALYTPEQIFDNPELVDGLEIETVFIAVDATGHQASYYAHDNIEELKAEHDFQLEERIETRYSITDINGHQLVLEGTKDDCLYELKNVYEPQSAIYEVLLKDVPEEKMLVEDWQCNNWSEGPPTEWGLLDSDGDHIDYVYSEEEAMERLETDRSVAEVQEISPGSTDDVIRLAKEMGFEGVLIKNVSDGGPNSFGGEIGDVRVVFDPAEIRSIYAAFDTVQLESENILQQGSNRRIDVATIQPVAPMDTRSNERTLDLVRPLTDQPDFVLRSLPPKYGKAVQLIEDWKKVSSSADSRYADASRHKTYKELKRLGVSISSTGSDVYHQLVKTYGGFERAETELSAMGIQSLSTPNGFKILEEHNKRMSTEDVSVRPIQYSNSNDSPASSVQQQELHREASLAIGKQNRFGM